MDAPIAQELGTDLSHVLHSPASDALSFTEQEQMILKLWDQEQELRLEINLLKAQRNAPQEGIVHFSEEDVKSEMKRAEEGLLTARVKFNLRNNIIQHVLITDPVLKAVHSGNTATHLERRLLPLVNERDAISMAHTALSSKLEATHNRLAVLERERVALNDENKSSAQKMLAMANDAKTDKIEEVEDPRLRAQLENLENDLIKARKEWRVLKSLTSSMIAGSGVDWAKDPKLLDVVMDEEDELG